MPDLTYTDRGTVDVVVASAARTTSNNSGALTGYGATDQLRCLLLVTAVSGVAPTLDLVLEDSLDGGTTWTPIATFTQKTAAGSQALDVTTPYGPLLRARWTIAGTTPSFTFTVRLLAK